VPRGRKVDERPEDLNELPGQDTEGVERAKSSANRETVRSTFRPQPEPWQLEFWQLESRPPGS